MFSAPQSVRDWIHELDADDDAVCSTVTGFSTGARGVGVKFTTSQKLILLSEYRRETPMRKEFHPITGKHRATMATRAVDPQLESLLVKCRTHSVPVSVEDWTQGWFVNDGAVYNTAIRINIFVKDAGVTFMTFQRSIPLPVDQEEILVERGLHHHTGEFQATAAANAVGRRWNRTRLSILP